MEATGAVRAMKSEMNDTAVFVAERGGIHCRAHMSEMFLYAAAPILTGVKPAALITISARCLPAWRREKSMLRSITGLCVAEVKGKNSLRLFIYDRAALLGTLANKETAALLEEYGYAEGEPLETMLAILKFRLEAAEFPHEIGLFLGYPPADVRSFVENKGHGSLCCRYWKVYHDVEKALETFDKIDRAHSLAASLLSRAFPIGVAAERLKAA